MARKRHMREQVIGQLREAEGSTVAEAARRIRVAQQTFCR